MDRYPRSSDVPRRSWAFVLWIGALVIIGAALLCWMLGVFTPPAPPVSQPAPPPVVAPPAPAPPPAPPVVVTPPPPAPAPPAPKPKPKPTAKPDCPKPGSFASEAPKPPGC